MRIPPGLSQRLPKSGGARDCAGGPNAILRGRRSRGGPLPGLVRRFIKGGFRRDGFRNHSEWSKENSWVCEMLSTRFPWLIVDEYQDLGGPLDKIVNSLTTKAHVKVFAVGDPDQTIYDFTGANPKYLAALSRRPDFTEVRLKFNYRSGRQLIDASQAALAPAEPRNYRPDPGRDDEGEVLFYGAEPELESHAALIATEIIPEMQARRVPLDEIAILYRQPSVARSSPQSEEQLADANIPFIAGKDSRISHGHC